MRDVRTRGETPLHRAAAFASEDTIQLLLDAGAKIDAKDMHGDSPLTWASWYLRPDSILRKLLYDGFSIHQRGGRWMQTCLELRLRHSRRSFFDSQLTKSGDSAHQPERPCSDCGWITGNPSIIR